MNATSISAAAVTFLFLSIFAWKTLVAEDYETAEYRVIEKDGRFEIREYPDLMMAATSTQLDAQGRDGSFMKLFRYISGANASGQKISMTTPVFMGKEEGSSAVQMGFVMPKEVAVKGIPKPTGEQVEIRKRNGGRFAVIRFSGQMNSKTSQSAEEKLRAWMKEKNLVESDSDVESGVETAGYDAPYVPSFLRRNEVLIRLNDPVTQVP
jgi:DNA gyrase inhibitor GyrI